MKYKKINATNAFLRSVNTDVSLRRRLIMGESICVQAKTKFIITVNK